MKELYGRFLSDRGIPQPDFEVEKLEFNMYHDAVFASYVSDDFLKETKWIYFCPREKRWLPSNFGPK